MEKKGSKMHSHIISNYLIFNRITLDHVVDSLFPATTLNPS